MKINIETIPRQQTSGIIKYAIQDSVIGSVLIGIYDEKLCWLGLIDDLFKLQAFFPKSELQEDKNIDIADNLESFLQGKTVSLDMVLYGTEFQRNVWQVLIDIPHGETRTYQDIANDINRTRAVRAVGTAIGSNPISIFIPCHRVIGKGKNKLKYRWGSCLKNRILQEEGVNLES